jgi:hypothetical protein
MIYGIELLYTKNFHTGQKRIHSESVLAGRVCVRVVVLFYLLFSYGSFIEHIYNPFTRTQCTLDYEE